MARCIFENNALPIKAFQMFKFLTIKRKEINEPNFHLNSNTKYNLFLKSNIRRLIKIDRIQQSEAKKCTRGNKTSLCSQFRNPICIRSKWWCLSRWMWEGFVSYEMLPPNQTLNSEQFRNSHLFVDSPGIGTLWLACILNWPCTFWITLFLFYTKLSYLEELLFLGSL